MTTTIERSTDTVVKIAQPKKHHVVLHNDDKTAMDFVVWVLSNIFHHDGDTAHRMMMNIHTKGSQIVGTYSRDIAETKVMEVHDTADAYGYPLKASVEEE